MRPPLRTVRPNEALGNFILGKHYPRLTAKMYIQSMNFI
jgi:hypothetical protein